MRCAAQRRIAKVCAEIFVSSDAIKITSLNGAHEISSGIIATAQYRIYPTETRHIHRATVDSARAHTSIRTATLLENSAYEQIDAKTWEAVRRPRIDKHSCHHYNNMRIIILIIIVIMNIKYGDDIAPTKRICKISLCHYFYNDSTHFK